MKEVGVKGLPGEFSTRSIVPERMDAALCPWLVLDRETFMLLLEKLMLRDVEEKSTQ